MIEGVGHKKSADPKDKINKNGRNIGNKRRDGKIKTPKNPYRGFKSMVL